MDNVQKAIDLAAAVNSKVENITFEKIRENANGEYLWSVTDVSNNTTRYVIEGSSGTLILVDECSEEEAIEHWENV